MNPGFELSQHAQHQMKERNIQPTWVDIALSNPDRLLTDADSHQNTHYIKQIEEFGNRWLRVIVNPNIDPKRVITVFFDRRIK